MEKGTISITVRNPDQNAGQSRRLGADWGNNLPLQPSVEDLNRIIVSPEEYPKEPEREHLLGTHVREAVAIVKDWLKDR